MKAGKSNYDVGTKIRITKVDEEDSDFLVGMEGTLTHPFGCYPANYVGVYLDEEEAKQRGIDTKCNLSRTDKFKVINEQ
jgi:hypothetical protein